MEKTKLVFRFFRRPKGGRRGELDEQAAGGTPKEEHIARKREQVVEWGVDNVVSDDLEGVTNEIYWQANQYGFLKTHDIKSIAEDVYARKLAHKTPPSDD